MDKTDLTKQQDELQQEAHKILGEIHLMNLLSKYGKPEVIGSVALGLMTWRDIDIEGYCQVFCVNPLSSSAQISSSFPTLLP